MENGCCISLEKTFFVQFISLLTRVIIVCNNKHHSHFCTRNYRGNWHLFIMTSYHSKLFAAAKKHPRKKPALNSPAKHWLKNINSIAKINQNNDNATKGQNFSASHTKITHDSSSSKSNISSDEENTDPPQYWTVDILNKVAAFQKACL